MKEACVVFGFVFLLGAGAEAASNISGLEIKEVNGGYRIFLKASGKLDCAAIPQDNPMQIVFDCPNSNYKPSQKILTMDKNPMIAVVRFLEHSKNGSKATQVVVDLKATVEYSLNASPKGASLTLNRPTSATPPKPVGAVSPPSKEPPPSTGDMVIGPEDLVEVSVFEMPQFNVTTRVAGDGTITMPLIGSVQIRGLSKTEAEKTIVRYLNTKYVKDANVSLQIKEYKSKQVSILGAVSQPGAYYVLSYRSLLHILSEAGGLSPEAGNRCFIFREGHGRMEINLHELLHNGNQELNISILPGDVISVPIRVKEFVYVLGAVKTPGALEMLDSQPMTLVAAISMAGGLTTRANSSGIEIKRKVESGGDKLIKVNLDDILKGKKEDVPLVPGDVINVRQSFF